MQEKLFRVLAVLFVTIWSGLLGLNLSGRLTSQTAAAQSSEVNHSRLEDSPSKLDFSIINSTPGSIAAVYVSPSESSTWGENLISGSKLSEGDELKVRFSRNEQTILWDIKVEGVTGRYAELPRLNLTEISRITLSVIVNPQNLVVAKIE